jgi:hypothetical protein
MALPPAAKPACEYAACKMEAWEMRKKTWYDTGTSSAGLGAHVWQIENLILEFLQDIIAQMQTCAAWSRRLAQRLRKQPHVRAQPASWRIQKCAMPNQIKASDCIRIG